MYASLLISRSYQSIVLFEVGYHAEGMAGIADMIERCPVEVMSACSSVQASFFDERLWQSHEMLSVGRNVCSACDVGNQERGLR